MLLLDLRAATVAYQRGYLGKHWTVLHVAQTMAREQQENDASRNEATSLVLEVPLASKLGKFGVERQSSCGGWRQLEIACGARAMEAT